MELTIGCTTRPYAGLPYGEAFERIAAAFGREMEGIVVRDRKGEPIGGCVLLRHGAAAVVPSASSLRSRFRLCPNHLLYWTALRRAREGGAKTFDFGRSTEGSGTYRFKKQWGAVERPLHWHYQLASGQSMPEMRVESPKYHLAQQVWKRLPVALSTCLSARLVRYLP